MLSDNDLMSAVRGGDLQAFEQLILKYQASAWNTAYQFLGDTNEAQDLAQEAFLRIFVAANRYRPTASFQTYLYNVVTRLCIDYVRKKRPTYSKKPSAVKDDKPPAVEQAAKKEMEKAIRRAIDLLPPKQRMAVVLRYFEGIRTRQIALAMGMSPKAIERALYRARKKLEPILENWLEK